MWPPDSEVVARRPMVYINTRLGARDRDAIIKISE